MTPTQVLPPEHTLDVRRQVDELIERIGRDQEALASNFVRLSVLVREIQERRYWKDWGYKGFEEFIKTLEGPLNKKRGQIYSMLATVAYLPAVSEKDLLTMGITKAGFLKDYVRKTGKELTPDLLERAKDKSVTVEVLKADVHQKIHGRLPESHRYYTVNYVATREAHEEINKALERAKRVGEVPHDISDGAQTAAALTFLAQEFLGSHGAEDEPQETVWGYWKRFAAQIIEGAEQRGIKIGVDDQTGEPTFSPCPVKRT